MLRPDTFIVDRDLIIYNNLNVTGGTLDISTNTNAVAVYRTLTVDGGTFLATNGEIDANYDFVLRLRDFHCANNWSKFYLLPETLIIRVEECLLIRRVR